MHAVGIHTLSHVDIHTAIATCWCRHMVVIKAGDVSVNMY